ncbi:hypothetical protein TB2_036360 [Malus domestica]
METVVSNLCSPFLLSQLGNSRPCLLKLRTSVASRVFKRCFAAAIKVRAAASGAVVEVEPTKPIVVQNDGISSNSRRFSPSPSPRTIPHPPPPPSHPRTPTTTLP